MITKNILFLSLSLTTLCIKTTAHEIKRPSLECTGKVAKERQPLFIQAEQYEENFIKARKQCLDAQDCETNKDFEQAKQNVLHSILSLVIHQKNLEEQQDGVCRVCEKNETKDIKNRLTELLKSVR